MIQTSHFSAPAQHIEDRVKLFFLRKKKTLDMQSKNDCRREGPLCKHKKRIFKSNGLFILPHV